jgi:BirA family biotin operon repressor/biotin-[acetyl-CoA-carboxylase] ligase
MGQSDNMKDEYDHDSILENLHTSWLGRELLFFRETGSTNDERKQRAADGAKEGLVAAADIQSKGKGRKGREWTTPEGVNIAMSYLLRPDIPPDSAPMITLVMALAAAKGIREVSALDVKIKWPNDIVMNGKKLAGILTEMTAEQGHIGEVIVGTGINVNAASLPDEIKDKATSIFMESGKICSRAKVAAAVTDAFEGYYATFLKDGDLRGLREEYNASCVNVNAGGRVLDPAGEYDGTAHGIDERGELIVTKEDGSEERIYAGEVSVRGIYGYV